MAEASGTKEKDILKLLPPPAKPPKLTSRRIGIHTSTAGGVANAAERAYRLGYNTLQIFSSSPRQWKPYDLTPEQRDEMIRLRAKYDLRPLVIHANYLVNLAGGNPEFRAKSIAATGRQAIGIRCDAASKADLESALAAAIERFGRVDTLINAAGVNSGTPFFEIGEAEWQRILDIDLKSVFLACQVFGKAMVDAGRGGSIINISSASAGPPLSKVFTYGIAKAGINQITQFLARDLAPHNIRVNAIQPGFFPAEQNRKLLTEERVASIMAHTPMNRFGESDELVGAAVYLASPRAASTARRSVSNPRCSCRSPCARRCSRAGRGSTTGAPTGRTSSRG